MDKIWTSFRGRPSAPLAQGEYLRAWRELTSGGKAQATFGGVSVEWALSQVSMRSGRDFWFNRPWRAWRAWPPRASVARSKPIARVFRGATPTGQARGKRVGPAFARRKTARGNPPIHRGWRPAIGGAPNPWPAGSVARQNRAARPPPRPFVRARSPPGRFGRSSRRRGPGGAWAVSAVVGVSHGAGNGPLVPGRKFSVRRLKAARSAPATISPQELVDPRLPPGVWRSLSVSS